MAAKRSAADDPVIAFETAAAWRRWLRANHKKSDGIWIRFYKKVSRTPSITYAEAVEEALCYGWIDSKAKRLDASSYVQRFSPRRPRGLWSKINIERAERLIAEGRMRQAGLAQVAAAQADGRWQRAYEPPSRATIPGDFTKALARNPQAKAFFATLNRANIYAICWRLDTAKRPETRARRIAQLVAMFAENRALH